MPSPIRLWRDATGLEAIPRTSLDGVGNIHRRHRCLQLRTVFRAANRNRQQCFASQLSCAAVNRSAGCDLLPSAYDLGAEPWPRTVFLRRSHFGAAR
nr:hypothetical protein [Zymomonas mobilis]